LLIDDDALFRRSLSFHLQQACYQVQAAARAEDGLKIICGEPIDWILLDIGLPGMDGLEALPPFNNQVVAPVIFITPRRRELDEILGLELGADDYITKPINPFLFTRFCQRYSVERGTLRISAVFCAE